ncbi:MAG: hypothetical protein ABIN61_00840 [candidate division WOR-3 bacterium]
MGIINFILSISELILPSGVQIFKDEECSVPKISVGFELSPIAKIIQDKIDLFERDGYNYYYLKNPQSIYSFSEFISLLCKGEIFFVEKIEEPINLLRLVLKDFPHCSSPIVNLSIGITGDINEEEVIELARLIPDSIISLHNSYYNLERVFGKHIYRGKENFIANFSPPPYSEDFCSFLVFLKVMNNREFRVRFSPETAPSPFFIYLSIEKVPFLTLYPSEKEIKRAALDLLGWVVSLTKEESRSKLLVFMASMGVEMDTFKNWILELESLEEEKVINMWKRYLMDGFVACCDSILIKKLKEVFPESEVLE